MAEEFNANTFTEKVKENEGIAVVDFFAPWCGPCITFAPTFNEVADEMKDKATFGKINVDETPQIAQEYGVMSIPTLLITKNGKEVARSTGSMGKEEFIAYVNAQL